MSDDRSTTSAFIPVLILGLILLGWFVFQALQLRSERDGMREVIAKQETPMGEAKKLRDALDALARGTAQLADQGDRNAQVVVDDLKKRGITITPGRKPGDDATSPPK